MGESSNEDKNNIVGSNERSNKQTLEEKPLINANPEKDSSKISDESAYFVHHPPKYVLPPHQDPKLAALDLREQIKIICSYHTLISNNIADLAKMQIVCCENIEPINSETLRNKNFRVEGGKSNNDSDVYVSVKGRPTKRKYYAESDLDPCKDDDILNKESNNDQCTSRKKAALTPSRNKNLKQKQLESDILESADSGIKGSTKAQFQSTKQHKKANDGFLEPALPTTSKKTTKKMTQCPICGVDYPDNIVEQHASTCGEISVEVGNISSNQAGFQCENCQELMSSMEHYQMHITACNERILSKFQS